MRALLAGLLLSVAAWGQQSAIYTGASFNYHINSTFTPQAIDYRVDARLHNWTLPGSGMAVFELQWIGVKVLIYASGELYCASTRDGGTLLQVGTNFLSGKNDVIIRVQRKASENRLYCEVRTTDLASYASASLAITGSAVWSDANYTRAVLGGYMATTTVPDGQYTGRIDYLRVSSTVLPLQSRLSWQDTTLGDIASWEYEGDATVRRSDSSGNGKTLTAVNTPTFAASLTGDPISSPRGDNATIFSQAPMKAGQSNTLGNWSICRNNAPCASYFWTQTGGPSTLTWSSRTAAEPTFTGAVATTGTDYTIRLVTTDTSGASTTTDLALGAVAVDSNDIVIVPNATVTQLMGSPIRFGGNPWSYADYAQKDLADYFVSWINSDLRFANYWDTAKTGTVSVTNGSTAVTGSGTAFQTDLACAPGTGNTAASGDDATLTWVSGPTYTAGLVGSKITVDGLDSTVIGYTDSTHITIDGGFGTRTGVATQIKDMLTVWYTRASDGSVGRYDAQISTCSSNTSLTLVSNYPRSTQSGRSFARGTYSQYAGWGDDGNNFYDVVRGLYVMYYRTGLSTYLTAARTLAQRFYSAPFWDQQEWATLGEFLYPRYQAHAGLWIAYHENTDNFPATFPTRMGYVATDTITRTQYYVTNPTDAITDAREVSYQVAALQYAAKWAEPSGSRTTWQGRVDYLVGTTYPVSKFADGSYPNNPAYQTGKTFNVTNGSASVTLQSGTINAAFCSSNYSTGTVSISGTTLTGSGTTWTGGNVVAAYQIEIYGTGLSGREATYRSYVVSVDSATQLTLAHAYTGSNTSGLSYRLWSYSGEAYQPIVFATGQYSADTEYYTCTYVSPTSLTLDRIYAGTTGTGASAKGYTKQFYPGNISLPFWHSIITEVMQHVKILTTGATSTAAATIMGQVKDYMLTKGYYAAAKGNYYAVNGSGCDPDPTRMTGCSGWNGSPPANRDFASEQYGPLGYVYIADPVTADKTQLDLMYTAAFGALGYASPSQGDGQLAGIYSTSGSSLLFNAKNGKTYGQPFGVGNAPAWPAARLGGIAPLTTATKSIKARLADVSGATDIVVDFQAADGTVSTSSACTSAACTFSADTRQGYRYRVRYRNGGATTIAQGEYTPVQ